MVEQRRDILGLVLTHAHEDHFFGAVIDLGRAETVLDVMPFTAALLQAQRRPGALNLGGHIVPLGGRFTLGPVDISLVDGEFDPQVQRVIILTLLGPPGYLAI